MAKPKSGAIRAPKRTFGWRDLGRVAAWGAATACAVLIAVYAGSTDVGHARLQTAFAEFHEALLPSGAETIRPLDAREGRRLAEDVGSLIADRRQLVARLDTLEHNVEDVTGSIERLKAAAAVPPIAPVTPEPAPTAAAPADDVTSSIAPQSAAPAPPASGVARTEFGLDLGTAPSIEALRTAWTFALKKHGALLEGLRPVVQMRERPRPASMEFRLIAGPIVNAATAARLCATMTASGSICAPAVFDGQRLAVR